ncbi:uncharacterized protein LOC126784535 [Argentina anserina]|uniref:uncharacterized protein LOC126784535 n=1 Tax=Argentina anserina TaxID=57926 RepID=UPI0021762208|nr:uncharacterized protein LOC126784535 [Potentilla anserina]
MEHNTTPEIAIKKLSNMLRLMMKRGKILGKSVNDFMLRHNTTLDSVRCRSLDDVHASFVYPLEYEFSCSSSPPHHQRSRTPGHLKRSNTNYNNGRYYHHQHSRRSVYVPMMCDDVLGSKNVSFCGGDVVEPLRRRPRVRRVRITEWEPLFPLNTSEEEEEEWHVDKAAQEFIDNFYRDLMLQKWNTVADRCY